MSDNEGCLSCLVACVAGIAIGICIGLCLGVVDGRSNTQKQAIEHHAAEYRCDPVTGKTEFVWLTDKAETP